MPKGLWSLGLAVLLALAIGPLAHAAIVVDRIEVVQTVQDLDAPVPIIAGKPTLVRAYVHSTSGHLGIHADLAIDGGPGAASGTVSSTKEVLVDPGEAVVKQRLAPEMKLTLNFLLPNQYLAAGTKSLSLTHLTDGQRAPVACSNCATFKSPATFVQAPPLHVHVLLVTYFYGPNHLAASPRPVDVESLRSWLVRAFPTGSVVIDTAPFQSSDAWPYTCVQLDAQLLVARQKDMESRSADQHAHYLALVPNNDRLMYGCSSTIPDDPNPAVVASAPSGPPRGLVNQLPVNVKPETDASFAGWYGGHELMHTFGRSHPGICHSQTIDDYGIPDYLRDEEGLISPRNPVSVIGYDIGATPGGTHMLSGLQAWDIMTYCQQPDWPSPYTYKAVFARLQAESALNIPPSLPFAQLDPAPLVASPRTAGPPAMAQASATDGGAPVAKPDAPDQKTTVASGFVSVQAIVNLSKATATLKFINQSLNGPSPAKPPAAGKPWAQLKFIDDKGATISSYDVAVHLASDTAPDADKLGLVNATIAEPTAASKIQLWFNDKLADSRDIFDVKPLVKKAPSTAGPGAPITLQWTFLNADPNAKVSYDVQTSQNGYIWSTFMVGLKDNYLTLTPELAKIPYFRVIANDGVHNSTPKTVKAPANAAAK